MLALGFGAFLPRTVRAAANSGFLATGYDKLRAQHMVSRIGPDFVIRWDLPLPGRGHGSTVRPHSNEGLVVARRPGRFAIVFDIDEGRERHRLSPAAGRHFYGHGIYSPDGKTLWMTENNFDNGQGVIGVYDAANGYVRTGEFPSGGIGPHQLLLTPGGRTLAVANGGILTHPDNGREKLNIDTMRPSLAYIDARNGTISNQIFFSKDRLQKLSIRHIALTADGSVCVGCQDQLSDGRKLPLVYLHNGQDSRLAALPMPQNILSRFNGYCGSVVFDTPGRTLAVSSPRGGLVGFWRLPDGKWQGHVELADGCALAPSAGGMVVSSGNGTIETLSTAFLPINAERHAFRRWDNHMTPIAG